MKKWIVALAFFAVSCASAPPAVVAGLTFHSVHTTLAAAADAKHVLCDPSVPLDQPILAHTLPDGTTTTCTFIAHNIGLTDAKYRDISGAFQQAFNKEQVYGNALTAWSKAHAAGDPAPASADLRKQLNDTVDLVGAVSNDARIQALVKLVKAVLTSLDDIETALRGAK